MLFPKLGKKPATLGAIKLKLEDYIDKAMLLPKVPTGDFGHQALFAKDGWGMLGNDALSDCVFAGAAHETMILTKLGGHPVNFTALDAQEDYSAVTGYDPKDASTDQGTDMLAAAKYRQNVGIRDDKGLRHKVAAYCSIDPSNLDHILIALHLFEVVGLGFEIPSIAMTQFGDGAPWDATDDDGDIIGGHYVPLVGRTGRNLDVVTYGKLQAVTPKFFAKYCDEAVVYLSTEQLVSGKSPEGFDYPALQRDLALLQQQ